MRTFISNHELLPRALESEGSGEQFIQWHHTHRSSVGVRKPVTYLILIGDAVHNFLGGFGIASAFLIDPKARVIAWIAAAAHEVPQELGDFGVLVYGGWPRRRSRRPRGEKHATEGALPPVWFSRQSKSRYGSRTLWRGLLR